MSGMQSMNGIARHLGSFKLRLVAFFLLLSLLPLIAALWAFSEVAQRSETARADTRVNAALRIAAAEYSDQVADAQSTATALARATAFQQALVGPSRVALSRLYKEQPNAGFFAGELPDRRRRSPTRSVEAGGARGLTERRRVLAGWSSSSLWTKS